MYFRLNFLDLPSVVSEMKILNDGEACLRFVWPSEAESLRNVPDEVYVAFTKW